MAAEYQLISTNLKTGRVIEELPWSSFQLTEQKNAPNVGSFKFPLRSSPTANKITEDTLGMGNRAVVVLRGGLPIGRYILWDASGSYSGNQVTFAGTGTVGYLMARRIRANIPFDDIDQFTIVDDLVEHAMGSTHGDIDLRTSHGLLGEFYGIPHGTSRTRTYLALERQTYLSAINEMSSAEEGFEWYETTEDSDQPAISKYFTTMQLRNTTTIQTDIVLDLAKNIEALTFNGSARGLANVFDSFSKPKEGADPRFAVAFNTESLNDYPQYDGIETINLAAEDVSSALLQSRADLYAREHGAPTRSYAVSVREDVDAAWTDYVLGNVMKLTASFGYLESVNERVLLNGRTLAVTQSGQEKIGLQLSRMNGN
jgi:hypothetical protein